MASFTANLWPSHWYNNSENQFFGFRLVCPAVGCDRSFKEEKFEEMRAHWNQLGTPIHHSFKHQHWDASGTPTSDSYPTLYDHVILFAMSYQTKCIHVSETGQPCNFDPAGDLRALLGHEQRDHNGKTDMSTIGKFLALLRKGLVNLPDPAYEKFVFNRLVSNIVARPDLRDAILKKENIEIRHMGSQEKRTRLATILGQQNAYDGRRSHAVTPQQDFLARIAPTADDGTDWLQAWEQLRSMYAQGTI
ncbi:hypothetical protein BDR22DRAFT_580042 [Usnea florida]